MDFLQSTQDFSGKPVINIQDGQKIAAFEGLMIDPQTLEPAALITSRGSLLRREIKAIPAGKVRVWGRDVILVDGQDVILKQEELHEFDKWLSVADDLKGRSVVSLDGKRIGQIDDVLVTVDGRLVFYELAQVQVDELLEDGKRLSVEATRSMGEDYLVVELPESVSQDEMPEI